MCRKKKVLILVTKNSSKYFIVPKFISFLLHSKTISFSFLPSNDKKKNLALQYASFLRSLFSFCKNSTVIHKKKLKLKGLGYRVSFGSSNNILEFKLGFGHLVSLSIPKEKIKVILFKTVIIIEGFSKVEVGNFAQKIRSLRTPDIYKGKGFWYSYEKEKLKAIKKK